MILNFLNRVYLCIILSIIFLWYRSEYFNYGPLEHNEENVLREKLEFHRSFQDYRKNHGKTIENVNLNLLVQSDPYIKLNLIIV